MSYTQIPSVPQLLPADGRERQYVYAVRFPVIAYLSSDDPTDPLFHDTLHRRAVIAEEVVHYLETIGDFVLSQAARQRLNAALQREQLEFELLEDGDPL